MIRECRKEQKLCFGIYSQCLSVFYLPFVFALTLSFCYYFLNFKKYTCNLCYRFLNLKIQETLETHLQWPVEELYLKLSPPDLKLNAPFALLNAILTPEIAFSRPKSIKTKLMMIFSSRLRTRNRRN